MGLKLRFGVKFSLSSGLRHPQPLHLKIARVPSQATAEEEHTREVAVVEVLAAEVLVASAVEPVEAGRCGRWQWDWKVRRDKNKESEPESLAINAQPSAESQLDWHWVRQDSDGPYRMDSGRKRKKPPKR